MAKSKGKSGGPRDAGQATKVYNHATNGKLCPVKAPPKGGKK